MLRRTPSAREKRAIVACSIAVAASTLHASTPAEATVVKALTLAEKTEASHLVVHALVERTECEWEVPGAAIRTLITVRVLEVLKGDAKADDRLIIRQSGGQVGEMRQVAAGMNAYEPGEEAILFLEPLGPFLVEIGVGIGKYAIEPKNDGKWVTHAPSVAAVRFARGEPPRIEPIWPMTPEPLHQFLKRVRSHVRGIPTDRPMPRKGDVVHPTREIHR